MFKAFIRFPRKIRLMQLILSFNSCKLSATGKNICKEEFPRSRYPEGEEQSVIVQDLMSGCDRHEERSELEVLQWRRHKINNF